MLTKAEACRELGLSLSTLDRRIAAGDLKAKCEPHGRRHRVYVMLDDEPPGNDSNDSNDGSGGAALAVAKERIRGLEEQVVFLQEQLDLERRRNVGLMDELKAAQSRRSHGWRFWRRGGDRLALTGPAGRGMMDSKTH